MRTVKLTTDCGHSWTTNANGSDRAIVAYFLGQQFDVGVYQEEDLQTCVVCEIDGKEYRLAGVSND